MVKVTASSNAAKPIPASNATAAIIPTAPSVFPAQSRLRRAFTQIKEQIIDMALSSSGIRDTARVLGISTDTVLNELKKEASLSNVNQHLLASLNPAEVKVIIRLGCKSHTDASFQES